MVNYVFQATFALHFLSHFILFCFFLLVYAVYILKFESHTKYLMIVFFVPEN